MFVALRLTGKLARENDLMSLNFVWQTLVHINDKLFFYMLSKLQLKKKCTFLSD